MTDNEKLRYEYFIETGTVWIDTNDSIELDYLKWLEAKIIYTPCCKSDSDQLCLERKAYYAGWTHGDLDMGGSFEKWKESKT